MRSPFFGRPDEAPEVPKSKPPKQPLCFLCSRPLGNWSEGNKAAACEASEILPRSAADRISAKRKHKHLFGLFKLWMPLSETLRVSKCKETKPGIFPFNLARTSSFRSGKWKATFSQPSETALFRSVCFVLEINCRWSLAAWSADSKDPRSLRDLNSSVSWHAVNKWCKI